MSDESLKDISRIDRLVNLQTTSSPVGFIQSMTSIGILQIVAQPDCPAKARYRKDYLPSSNRRDPLGNKNINSNYLGPAVQVDSLLSSSFASEVSSAQISPTYLHPSRFFIGVSIATPIHEAYGCCLIHPYELESIDHSDYNDRVNNIVWYPIGEEDRMGLKRYVMILFLRIFSDILCGYSAFPTYVSYVKQKMNCKSTVIYVHFKV